MVLAPKVEAGHDGVSKSDRMQEVCHASDHPAVTTNDSYHGARLHARLVKWAKRFVPFWMVWFDTLPVVRVTYCDHCGTTRLSQAKSFG